MPREMEMGGGEHKEIAKREMVKRKQNRIKIINNASHSFVRSIIQSARGFNATQSMQVRSLLRN